MARGTRTARASSFVEQIRRAHSPVRGVCIPVAMIFCLSNALPAQVIGSNASALRSATHFEQQISLPPLDHIRKHALLGALIGGVSGSVVGFRAPCRDEGEGGPGGCRIENALLGLGGGLLVGNTIGAWAGGARHRCSTLRGLTRSAAGALLGTVPFATYVAATHNHQPRSLEFGFMLAVSMPLLQMEGASRLARGC